MLCSAQTNGSKLPPTMAFLKNPALLKAVQETYGKNIETHKDTLIRPILLQEGRYSNHISLYHGQKSLLLIVPDFLNRLYAFKNDNKQVHDFFMLRYWPLGSNHKTAQKFLDSFGGNINDHQKEIYDVLLAVNFAYFGNVHRANQGEATFSYVLNNQSCFCANDTSIRNILKTIFDTEKLSQKYIDDLVALVQSYAPSLGNTYQVILTPEAADKYLYFCKPGGMPHGPIYNTAGNIIAEHDYDATKGRYIKCSGVLKEYYTNPESIIDLDILQGRLLLSKDCILNPNSGVKIFSYTGLSPEKEKEYHSKLDELCNIIFTRK